MDDETEMMNTYASYAPSAEDVTKVEEKLDSAKSEQKNLFLVIFQVDLISRLAMVCIEVTFALSRLSNP